MKKSGIRTLARRAFLAGAAALPTLIATRDADATLVRGLTLPELVTRSQHVVVLTPLDAESHFEDIGGQRCIVTDTRVRVDESVARVTPADSELLVRTLGGRVGDLGEIVHGQPELMLGQAGVGFLVRGPDGMHWVTGMAQGHYPLRASAAGELRLSASPNLPSIRDWQASAVRRLAGQKLLDARRMVRELSRP